MRVGLTRRTIGASVLVTAVVAAVLGLLVSEVLDLRDSARAAERSDEVVAAANELERLTVDLETGQRGFLITADERFLEPWRAARARIPAVERELSELADDPAQRLRAQSIVQLIDAYLREYSIPVVETARTDRAEAVRIVAGGEGKRRLDAIRAQFERFSAAEVRRGAKHEQDAEDAAARARVLGVAGLGVSVLLILLFIVYVTRSVVLPLKGLAGAAGRLAAGDLSAHVDEGGAVEVGDLGRAFNAMAGSVKKNQEELDRFFTLSLDLLCIAGLDGYFKRLNPSFERTLGYTTEELTAKPFLDFVHPDDREATLAEVERLARGVDVISFENRYRCKDGSYRLLLWSATALPEQGLIYATARDITERKESEQALERAVAELRAVLDASPDGIRLIDLQGSVLFGNRAIERVAELFAQPAEGTIYERALAVAEQVSDQSGYRATLERMASDPEYEATDTFEHASTGRTFWRYTVPVRDASDAAIGRVTVVRETTAEREAERLKDELVATVSHELRTPLTSILGFAELLSHREFDEKTRRRYLETIRSEARRLTTLINDFLDLQRIESGQFRIALRSFDLTPLLREQAEVFAGQSERHTIEVDGAEEPLPVLGDRDRIVQLVANLLSNAIKYSPAGGPVTVTGERADSAVRVSVTDRGLGIPAAEQRHVFAKFFRVDSSDTREIGGTGLGLALCKEIAEAHGGRVGFESEEGAGSTFWFELPAARYASGEGLPRVLVVKDDPASASLIAAWLAEADYEVDVVATGEEALERAESEPPDAVCLDIGLAGELDGWDVLERLRAVERTAAIPVVVVTQSDDPRRAAALGAAEVLTKPFDAGRIRAAVARLLPDGTGSVLVVDDEEAVRALVLETLGPEGLEVREAADGEEALAKIAARAPDVIVLDLVMPKLDGFAVLDRLQEEKATRSIPVIVLTGKDLAPAERALLNRRTRSLLEKGAYSGDELRELVRRAIGQQALDRVE